MSNATQNEYDVIVVGSGTAGATVARELARNGKKVLMLEKGGTQPLKETLMAILAIAQEVKLGDGGLSTMRAITTGGSSSLYFGIAQDPDLDVLRRLGIDVAGELTAVRKELGVARMPEALMTAKGRRLRDSATALGHDWKNHEMLVDFSGCRSGYDYDAKWKARRYVDEAVAAGATLVTQATVVRVLADGGVANGVEYTVKRRGTQRAHAAKIVLAAGELATPKILRDSGVAGIGDRGFYCNPGYAIYGLVPGLGVGTDGFVGSSYCSDGDGIELGDANIPRVLFRPMMLGGLKLRHLFSYPDCIGIGVKVKDGYGGTLRDDGRFHKTFTAADEAKLAKGKQNAIRVLENAGAKRIVDFGLTAAGRVGGLVRIGEHVDGGLETELRGLHVCDGSVIPDEIRSPPAMTLLCLGRYLGKRLAAAA